MFVVCVTVQVKPEHRDAFAAATLANASATRFEPGNLRFDVVQAEEDPGRYLLWEAYRTPEDFQAHQRTEHYLRWKAAVADWMAAPRQALKCRSLFPDRAELW